MKDNFKNDTSAFQIQTILKKGRINCNRRLNPAQNGGKDIRQFNRSLYLDAAGREEMGKTYERWRGRGKRVVLTREKNAGRTHTDGKTCPFKEGRGQSRTAADKKTK